MAFSYRAYKVVRIIKYNKYLKISLILSFIVILSRILGFIRESIVAYYYGTSKEADMYFLAISIPEIFSKLLITGALGTILVPLFVKVNVKNTRSDLYTIYNFMSKYVLMFFLIVSLIIFTLASFLAKSLGQNYSILEQSYLTDLIRIVIFSIIFLSLSGVIKSYLNSLEIFIPSAIAPVIQNITFVVSSIFLVESVGLKGLAYAYLIAVVIQYIFQLNFVTRYEKKSKSDLLAKFEINKLLILSFPAIFTLFLTDLNVYIDKFLIVNYGEGLVAGVNYSNKILQLPIGIIAASVLTIIFPYFSKLIVNRELTAVYKVYETSIILFVHILVPLSLFLMFFSKEITELLFGYGDFNNRDIIITGEMLLYYSPLLLPLVIIMLSIRLYHSQSSFIKPMVIGLSGMIIKLVLFFVFNNCLELSYHSLLLSSVLSTILVSLLLYFSIYIDLKGSKFYKLLIEFFYSLLTGLITIKFLSFSHSLESITNSKGTVLINGFFFFLIYILMFILMRFKLIKEMKKLVYLKNEK